MMSFQSASSSAAAERARTLFAAWPTGRGACTAVPAPERAAEMLTAELAESLLWPRSTIVDVGCGVGRMAGRWLADNHRVTGIENDAAMLDILRETDLHPAFTLVDADADAAGIAPGSADLVTAFGTLQNDHDPAASIARFAGWVRPGGAVCVQVDGLLAAHAEMIRDGREAEADRMLVTRRRWVTDGACRSESHLFTASALREAFRAAGLVDIQIRGLMIGASLWGRIGVAARMRENEEAYLEVERSFWKEPAMTDQGLYLFASGRRPRVTAEMW